MSFFKNITRGGQLQIHQLRMFHQIANFAFFISFGVAVLFFIYQINSDVSSQQMKHSIDYIKADYLVKFSTVIPKIEAKQVILLNNRETKVRSSDILRSPYYLKVYRQTKEIISENIGYSIIVLVGSFLAIFAVWFYYGLNQKKTDTTKGIKLVKSEELARQIKDQKVDSDIIIEGLPLIKNAETRHILVTGTTGCGKTNLFDIILPQIRKRSYPNKAVVIDIKGKYVAKYYNPDTDFILNPFDARSVNWDIWSDCQTEAQYEAFAHSIIPDKKNQYDDVWDKSSRIVLIETLKKLAVQKKKNISEIFKKIDGMSLTELELFYKGTNAAKLIAKEADKTTFSILMNLVASITPLRYLSNIDNNYQERFSIRNWINSENNQGSWFFITARADQLDSIRTIMSTIIDIALNAALSLEEDKNRRIWFIADEIPALNKLSSLKKGLTLGRENGCSIMLGIQDIPQLRSIYGYDDAKTILNNINTHFIFRYQDSTTAREISEMLGVVEQEYHNETQSYGSSNIKDGVSFSKQTLSKSLVLPVEIANLKVGEAYVKYGGYDITHIKMKLQQIQELQPCFVEINKRVSYSDSEEKAENQDSREN